MENMQPLDRSPNSDTSAHERLFVRRWKRIGDGSRAYDVYREVRSRYDAHGRFHPTFDDLTGFLRWGEILSPCLEEPQVTDTAILLHALVFRPKGEPIERAKVNAQAAAKLLRAARATHDFVERVSRRILSQSGRDCQAGDDFFFRDILRTHWGSAPPSYRRYVEAVQQMQQRTLYPRIYLDWRIPHLRELLDARRIYDTDYFETNFGDVARENFRAELVSLGG